MSDLQIEKDWRPNFYLLWTGQAISRFTSAVLQLALVWYLTDVTGSASTIVVLRSTSLRALDTPSSDA